jgi:hypothetical protein
VLTTDSSGFEDCANAQMPIDICPLFLLWLCHHAVRKWLSHFAIVLFFRAVPIAQMDPMKALLEE